jgi:dihydrolipoamide dehydrogenase
LTKGVETLVKNAGAELIQGWATFSSSKNCTVKTENGDITIEAENVIIATGSSHIDLPFMPCDEEFVLSSTGALSLEKLPKKVAIVGGGYIGLELGCALRKLGTEVTVVEGMDSILGIMDKEIRRPLEIWLKKNKVTIHTNALAKGAKIKGKGASRKVELTFEKDSEEQKITVDKILVTVGRSPNSKGWGVENMGIRMDASGRFIRIDRQCRTSAPGVYAIGDVAGEPMLAHKASAQGEMVAEIISGEKREFDKVAIPAIVFTEPEIVSVGLTPDEAKEKGEEVIVGKFPLAANGRALTIEAEKTAGFIRVTARKEDHVILGIQAVGSHVAELHGEFILALEMGAQLEDISDTVHAHPTMTEAFHESVLKTLGHAIHTS